jgi:hypothetical protein
VVPEITNEVVPTLKLTTFDCGYFSIMETLALDPVDFAV